jgi:hypothetical protein
VKYVALLALVAACGDAKKPAQDVITATPAPTVAPLPGRAPGDPACPATGLWARCSLLYRLGRFGIAPRLDSTEKVEEHALHAADAFVIKFGSGARLEVFLYADSVARLADAKHLDMTTIKRWPAQLTIARERTLIENNNALALLTTLNDRLRERIDDAITGGAPQPPQPVMVKP